MNLTNLNLRQAELELEYPGFSEYVPDLWLQFDQVIRRNINGIFSLCHKLKFSNPHIFAYYGDLTEFMIYRSTTL